SVVFGQTTYILGAQGVSCNDVCYAKGLNCNPRIATNNSTSLFAQLGVNCTGDPTPWWAEVSGAVAMSSASSSSECALCRINRATYHRSLIQTMESVWATWMCPEESSAAARSPLL